MDMETAYGLIEKAIDTGRTANGYLIAGDVRGAAMQLAEMVLGKLFGPEQVANRSHPDVHWLEPELKTRVISVEAMREKMIDPMSQTSFSGGWKAGIVADADRMRQESANAFLKTLEEPPPQTLFLLLTGAPEKLLPTIVSRCQRIDLSEPGGGRLAEPWLSRVLSSLAGANCSGVTGRAAFAAHLCGILEEMKEASKQFVEEQLAAEEDGPGEETGKEKTAALVEARYRELRTGLVRELAGWFRDIAALRAAGPDAPLFNGECRELLAGRAARIPLSRALGNVAAAENLEGAFARNMKEDTALFAFADALCSGTEDA